MTTLVPSFFGWIILVLACKETNHKRLDEFEFCQDTELAALECLKNQ